MPRRTSKTRPSRRTQAAARKTSTGARLFRAARIMLGRAPAAGRAVVARAGTTPQSGRRGMQMSWPRSISAAVSRPGGPRRAARLRACRTTAARCFFASRRSPDREEPREDARHVGVRRGHARAEGERGHGRGHVLAEAGQPAQSAAGSRGIRPPCSRDDPSRGARGGCGRGRSSPGPTRPRARSSSRARASAGRSGNRARNASYRPRTAATVVCWSMTSETQIRYGSRVPRQGSARFSRRNQARSASRTDRRTEELQRDQLPARAICATRMQTDVRDCVGRDPARLAHQVAR